MHADSYWYAGNFDDWFLNCDSRLSVDDIADWFKKSLTANAADNGANVDGLSTVDAVTLKASSSVYPESGVLTTAAADYGIKGTCYVSADADTPDGTSISIETSTSDDLSTWSDFAALGENGEVLSGSAAYICFRVTLATADTSKTPVLHAINMKEPGESAFKKLIVKAHSRWR